MTKKDVQSVQKLLINYLDGFKLRLKLREQDVAHMLLPREDIVFSYVVENDDHQVTDFISFYRLPSNILQKVGHSHDQVNVSYDTL